MKQSYDIFNGGMSELLRDLELAKSQLINANNEIVKELSDIVYNDIMLNANKAVEPAQRADIRQLTTKYAILQGAMAYTVIANSSPKVTFAEFGYGVIGSKSPYRGESIFTMNKVGWQGYDLDSVRKREDGSWLYRDRFGELHKSSGEKPTHIWFYATQLARSKVESVVRQAIERNLQVK